MLACVSEKIEVVELLIKGYKVDINEQDYNGLTALHHCVYQNTHATKEISKYLCMEGINLNIKSKSGTTAIGLAEMNNDTRFIEMLKYQQKYGKWMSHPFNSRKKIL